MPDNLAPDHKHLDPRHIQYRYAPSNPALDERREIHWFPIMYDTWTSKAVEPDNPQLRLRWTGPLYTGESFPTHQAMLEVVRAHMRPGNDDATPNPLYDDQCPQTPDSPLRRCCADLCDPAKVQALADRTVCQAPEPAPDPKQVYEETWFPGPRGLAKTNLTFDEFLDKIGSALAPDPDSAQAPKISRSSLTYEEVLRLAHEVWALIEDGGANYEMAVSALMFRVLTNEGVSVR